MPTTMSTHGFYWVGFMRSLQGDFTSMALAIIGFTIVFFIARAVMKDAFAGFQQRWGRQILGRIFGAVIILIIGGFVLRAALVASYNRIPRSDVNASGVYQQMDSHLSNPDHSH